MENVGFYTDLFGYDEDEDAVLTQLKRGEFVTIQFVPCETLAGIPLSEYHALVATAQLATEYRAQVDILKTELEWAQAHPFWPANTLGATALGLNWIPPRFRLP